MNTPPAVSRTNTELQDLAPEDALYRRITRRFVPILFIAFVFNYMDRTNIGFAQLQMKSDLGFSDLAYGTGAGMLFITYSLFAVPFNLLMAKIGARKAIMGCLVGWGVVSAGTMFVRTPHQFYAIRLLLGALESGFFPGILFYFSMWYPSHRRANATGIFQSATVVAGIVSGVLSGALMTYLNGYLGLQGWQWLFVIEGLPSALLGVAIYFVLDDGPEEAKWLTPTEKAQVIEALKTDPAAKTGHHTMAETLRDWRVYLMGVIFFLAVIGTYVLAFWQPAMIRQIGIHSIMAIGLLSTIPAAAAMIAKIWIGYDSDKKRELRWHFAVPALAGAFGLLLIPFFPHSPVMGIAALTLATAGVHGCIPVFWSVPGLYLSGTAAAGGLALITTMGNMAGAVGPYLLGVIKTVTGSFDWGMYGMAVLLALAAVLVLAMVSGKENARPSTAETTVAAGRPPAH